MAADRALFTAELILTTQSDPATPPAGSFTLFPQANGKLYLKNSNGDVYPVGDVPGNTSDVETDGTALANQVGIWVDQETLVGFGGLTFDSNENRLAVGGTLAIGNSEVLQLGPSRIELLNIGYVDANTANAILTALNLDFNDIDGNLAGSRVTFGGTPDGTKFLRDDGTWQTVTVETFPSGAVMQYAGAAAPSGWLICDGAALATATYPDLFAAVGYTYGGAGATFNLPDLRQRVPVGVGTGFSLGQTGGAQTHTLTVNEMPAHSHTTAPHTHSITEPNNGQGHKHPIGVGTLGGVGGGFVSDRDSQLQPTFINNTDVKFATTDIIINNSTVTVNNSGGGQPHNNMQPYIVLNYIIKE